MVGCSGGGWVGVAEVAASGDGDAGG